MQNAGPDFREGSVQATLPRKALTFVSLYVSLMILTQKCSFLFLFPKNLSGFYGLFRKFTVCLKSKPVVSQVAGLVLSQLPALTGVEGQGEG